VNYLFNISAILLSAIHRYQHFRVKSGVLAKIAKNYFIVKHLVFTIVTGSDINPSATIGQGLFLPHPNGVIIHRDAMIGDGCIIMQQVTIGQLGDGPAPVLGNGVFVGAGAKVLGGVKIGDRARIGANSVVLCDVPAGKTAVGIPARVLP
jgi:serine O-acetyltransferase